MQTFRQLHHGSDSDILRFAQNWGLLGPASRQSFFTEEVTMIEDPNWEPGILRFPEHLFVWRTFSRWADSLLNIAGAVNLGRAGSESGFEVLRQREIVLAVHHSLKQEHQSPPMPDQPWKTWSLSRQVLSWHVNRWLHMSQARPHLLWDRHLRQWDVELTGDQLLALLALQLSVLVAMKDGLALCSECHLSYAPSRRPNANRRNYCPRCRRNGIPQRDAARDARARSRAAESKKG